MSSTAFAISPEQTAVRRNLGLDLGRLLGCFGVILIHQNYQDYGDASRVSDVLSQLSRWAVPFFFITSGYLLNQQKSWGQSVWKNLRRVIPIFLFWFLFYHIESGRSLGLLLEPGNLLDYLYTGGSGYHLWFLSHLALSVFIAFFFVADGRYLTLMVIGAAFFCVGLALRPYSTMLCGSYEGCLPIEIRNALTFGLIFVGIGAALRAGVLTLSVPAAMRLTAVGLLLTAAEIVFLKLAYDIPPRFHDMLLGTVPFATGLTVLFLNMDIRDGLVSRLICVLGPVSLGIYATHAFVLNRANDWFAPASLPGGLALAVFVFALSAALAVSGSKIPVVRRVFA